MLRAVRVDWLDAQGAVALSITSNMLPKTVDETFGPATTRKIAIELVGEPPQFTAAAAVAPGAFTFGQRYGFGNDNPGTVQVDSMEYSVERFPFFIGGSPYATAPTAAQKLVVVHYHLRNDGSTAWAVDFNTLHLRVTDIEGKTFDGNGRIVTDSDHRSDSVSLAPGGELVASSAIVVDGGSVLRQLAVAAADIEHPEIVYDLTSSTNPVKKLTAPFVAAGDTTGAVTPASIPITRGTTVPLGLFDAAYTGATLTKPSSADAGDAQWLARFTVRNRSLETQTLTVGTLTATTETAESDKPTPVAPASTKVGPGESVNIVFPFHLQAAPKRLQIHEGESRVYVINIAG